MTTIEDTRVDWSKVKSVTFKKNAIPWENNLDAAEGVGVPIGIPFLIGGFNMKKSHILIGDWTQSIWINPAHLFEPLPATP